MPDAAEALFRQAVTLGWDSHFGGFFYNLDWNDSAGPAPQASGGRPPRVSARPPSSSPIGHRQYHETWYRKIWDVIARHHLDLDNGGWHEQLTENMQPAYSLFAGKADIYHALQACLIPLYPAEGSLTKSILGAKG